MKHGLDMTGKVTVKENRICSKLESGLVEQGMRGNGLPLAASVPYLKAETRQPRLYLFFLGT
jgi:hypothetical protein